MLAKDQAAIATSLYAATYATLQLKDMDQDVKDASLTTLSLLLAHFGDLLKPHLTECFPLLLARLGNEVPTHLPSIHMYHSHHFNGVCLGHTIISVTCSYQNSELSTRH